MTSQPPEGGRPFFELTWEDIKGRIRELTLFLPQFLKNPVEGIKRVPSWDWPTVIILEAALSAVTSMLSGVVARHIVAVLGGIIVGPIMGLLLSFVLAGLFYYASLFMMKTELEFRKVFIVVVLAKVPAQIAGVLSPLSRAVTPVCIVVMAVLLVIGLTYNFMLERKKVTNIVGALAAIVLVTWLYTALVETTSNRIKVQEYTPESLDQIHKELNGNK